MNKSTHRAEVVPVELLPHPNAEKLSIVQVYGYQVCVRTEDWTGRTKGVYIVPDSMVDTDRPEFKFLADEKSNLVRIKAKKLRGIISYGLLMPVRDDANLGDDLAEELGITRYEPPEPATTGGDCVKAPEGYFPKYDVEAFQRYAKLFTAGEPVLATEKIHGTSSKFAFVNDTIYVGSHETWKKDDEKSAYWKAFRGTSGLEKFLKANPDAAVYGEVYGWVQDLRYGAKVGQVWLAVFDILKKGQWMNALEAREFASILPWVPIVSKQPFDIDQLTVFSNGKSLITGALNIREGIVIKPLAERWDPEIGRVQLKIVSSDYLTR